MAQELSFPIGVIGLGQMGQGIAQVAIQNGLQVKAYDQDAKSLERGMEFIKKQLQRGVVKGKWREEDMGQSLAQLEKNDQIEGLNNCGLIIEAVTENIEVKGEIFATLDKICPPSAVFASNTSSISITALGAFTKRPELVVGMHFMNPVPIMKLVEGIRGLATSDEAFSLVAQVAKKMGKTFIEVKDIPGFAINRILMPMINEAFFALAEGVASREDIDQGMKLGTNCPMGPLELADFIGLDTCLAIMEVLHSGLGDDKYRPCPLLKKFVVAKRLGRKSGRGIYDYA